VSPYVSATITSSGGVCTAGGSAAPIGGIATSGPATVCCSG
jgi:hypothetical protein